MAVEHELRLPRRRGERPSSACELCLVARAALREDRGGGEPGGDERLVDPVAGERVDEPGRVADEEDRPARRARRPADRQPAALHVRQLRVVDAVLGAQPPQVLAQPRPLAAQPPTP